MDFESVGIAHRHPERSVSEPVRAFGRGAHALGPRRSRPVAAAAAEPHQFVAQPVPDVASWPQLLATLAEPSARTLLAVVTQPDLAAAAEGPPPAMNDQRPSPSLLPAAAAELALGMCRGEIVLRYQPVVRLQDRRPVMVEALARWHRPFTNVPPETFFPLAERTGLARALSMVVALRAGAELGHLHARLGIGVSINLPLEQLLQHDLVQWLHEALRHTGLHPAQLALELTETTEVRDVSALHRAVRRLRGAGYRVLLDDIILDDERRRFFHLPFAGFKLDRSLVTALPDSARARRQVRDLVREAEGRGQLIIAEGVSDLRLWHAVRGLGIHHAQGFIVGRPLPAEALPAWWASWRSRQPA